MQSSSQFLTESTCVHMDMTLLKKQIYVQSLCLSQEDAYFLHILYFYVMHLLFMGRLLNKLQTLALTWLFFSSLLRLVSSHCISTQSATRRHYNLVSVRSPGVDPFVLLNN